MSKKTSRKVVRRSGRVNITKTRTRIAKRPSKQILISTLQGLIRTKTRKYIAYSLLCLALMQLILFFVYKFIYVGTETPSDNAFLIIIYAQTGLMFGSIGFLAAAAVSYLRGIKK